MYITFFAIAKFQQLATEATRMIIVRCYGVTVSFCFGGPLEAW